MLPLNLFSHNPFSLEGKLVLVAGGGTGIGEGVAYELARHGADVAVSYRSSSQGAFDLVERIQSLGRRAIAIQADLRRVEDCRRLVDEAVQFLGGLDGLFNNAGLTFSKPFTRVSEEEFNNVYDVNIRGQYFTCQQAVPYMIARGEELRRRYPDQTWAGGSIVNVSSVHGSAGYAWHSVYAGTKGAINAFSRELAIELCPMHIRVNVLAPGSIEVQSYFNDPNYSREVGDSLVPWGRVGLPEDTGYAAVYLMSDASEFMTGHVLTLDGGLTAKMAIEYKPSEGARGGF